MSPDDAAYAALNLRPGARWAEVTDQWRHLVKLYHPDRNPLLGSHEHRRLLEVNAAYEHLKAVAGRPPADGRVVVEGPPGDRREAWERVWDVATWPSWLPGIASATMVRGPSDRRGVVES